MDRIHKIVISIIACILIIVVGGEVLYHYNGDFRTFVNRLFHIKDSKEIDYDNDTYVISLKNRIKELEDTVALYESEDDILNLRIVELERRVSVLEEQVRELEEDKENLNQRVDALNEEMSGLWQMVFDYTNSGESKDLSRVVSSKIEELEEELEILQEEYEQISIINNVQIRQYNLEIGNLNDEKTQVTNQKNNVYNKLQNNTETINVYREYKNTYNTIVINLEEKVTNGTATESEVRQYNNAVQEIEETETKIANLESENENLSQRMINYTERLDDLEARIVVLEEKVRVLQEEIEVIENKIQDTENEIDKFTNYLEAHPVDHTHIGASPVIENKVNPTCEEDGHYEEVTYCKDDGYEMSRVYVTVKATGHKSGKSVKENIQADGTYDKVVYCTKCGTELSRETISGNDCNHHNLKQVSENYIDPTCDEDGGYDLVTYCNDCGNEISREFITQPAFGHYPSNTPQMENLDLEHKTYDEVIFCERCGIELSRETKEIVGNDFVYYSRNLGQVTISEYFDLTQLQQNTSKYIADGLTSWMENDNKYYIFHSGNMMVTGLWVYDKETQTLYLGDRYFGYDDYTIFECIESYYPNYLELITKTNIYHIDLQTNELTIRENDKENYNFSYENYLDINIMSYNTFEDEVKISAKYVIENLDSLNYFETEAGRMYYSDKEQNFYGVWIFNGDSLYLLCEDVMNVEKSKFYYEYEDNEGIVLSTDTDFYVYINKTNYFNETVYIYEDVYIINYPNNYWIKVNDTPVSKFIVDNLDKVQYFINSRGNYVIYEVDGNKSIGLWEYDVNDKILQQVFVTSWSLNLQSSDEETVVFSNMFMTLTYYINNNNFYVEYK